MRRVLVVADRRDEDPGWVGERLCELGAELVTTYREELSAITIDGFADRLVERVVERAVSSAVDDVDLLLLLGSGGSVHDPARADVVEAESALVRQAVEAGVPVIGICYGAQLAAHAFGGSVRPVEHGEVGWFDITSSDDALCPSGPWLQFHADAFTLPPGARLLGTTGVGLQGFVLEPRAGRSGVIGWQFHPETTPATLLRWVAQEPEFVVRHGGDPDTLIRETSERAEATRAATHRLVDAALRHLSQPI